MNERHDIAIVGMPLDHNSSFLQGAATAPPLIREAFSSASANLWTENGIDLGTVSGYRFTPELQFPAGADPLSCIEKEVSGLLAAGSRVVALGGDHSITYPVVRGYAGAYPQLNILHLDAHPDLYDELAGNRFSHACPFARIMEEQRAVRLVQVGIRTMTGHQRQQAERFGVEVIEMKNLASVASLTFSGPVYLSLDLDCLDPAFAPGVSHHEPGGMSTREVLTIIQNLQADLVGADIVEYNPRRDLQGMTAMVAGKLLKEIVGKMLAGSCQQG